MITYKVGNLLDAFDAGEVHVVAHCCNLQGTIGAGTASGIAGEIMKRYPQVAKNDEWACKFLHEEAKLRDKQIFNLHSNAIATRYKRLEDGSLDYDLSAEDADYWIVNLYGQEFYGNYGRQKQETGRNVSYPAISKALIELRDSLLYVGRNNAVIGFPKYMGSFRAGGDWKFILELIKDVFFDFNVVIYELESPELFNNNLYKKNVDSYPIQNISH